MNDLIIGLYEFLFDFELYQDLLDKAYRENSFAHIGYATIFSTILCLFIFYKVWDPVEGQRKKWIITLLLNSVIVFTASYLILYNKQGIIEAMGEYVEGATVSPYGFVFQIAGMTFIYALILAIICCLTPLPVKYFSNDNKHNPF
jgi:formate hydrogenlyase subunit 3/multisubunit Na+/H+ antiporter MnhD subunit